MHENLLTLADVASLARVQRPVVSTWRSRFTASGHPFPSPVDGSTGSERFAASDVGAWLSATSHGNNPDAAEDAASFGSARAHDRAAFEAMLALRAVLSEPVSAMAADALREQTAATDPNNLFIRAEIDGLGDGLTDLAVSVDAAVEAAYTPGVAFARNAGPNERTTLAGEAQSLVADIALVLAGSEATGEFVDPTGTCADLMLAISDQAGESSDVEVVLGAGADAPARSARRRLTAHGISWRNQRAEEARAGSTTSILIAQFPHASAPTTAVRQVLESVESAMLSMPAQQRGVIIAPATALTDVLSSSLIALRRDLLRDGRVRAIIRLPEKLLVAHPRQALAIWVLGPATEKVSDDQRWTMLADVGERTLDSAARGEIVGDVFASMGGASELKAHSFAIGSVSRTSSVVAQEAPLNARSTPAGTKSSRVPFEAASAQAVRIEQLIEILGDSAKSLSAEPITATDDASTLPPETIGVLRRAKALRYSPGTRLVDEEIGVDGYSVVGIPELTGVSARGSRKVGIIEFERNHPRSVRTSPGDVIFCTGSVVAAVVDSVGGSVVQSPARLLTAINPEAGLVPEIIVADICSRPQGARRWNDWAVRRVLPARVPILQQALVSAAALRADAERQLRAVDELDALLADGAVTGSITHPLLSSHLSAVASDGTAPKGS